ncbi:MAG: hypothetical protein M3R02_12325 [Chloroflexota bacterium]|nr:hypothetical protein [Chloroflexota bacterium]
MLSRRDTLKLAAGVVVSFAPLSLPASAAADPAPLVITDPAPPAVMTVDDIMDLYRRMFVLRAPVDRDDGTTTWANDDAIFVLDRRKDQVVVYGASDPEWHVGTIAGTVPLLTWCVGRPPLTAAYALLFLTAEGERRATSGNPVASPPPPPEHAGWLTIRAEDGIEPHAYGEVRVTEQPDGTFLVRPVRTGPHAWRDA